MIPRVLILSAAAFGAMALVLGRPATTGAEERVPVLVELFTSEGCSSCPPADALLIRLEKLQPVPGAEIIALSEHVDYWNRLGWTDPFSSAEFSRRQDDYAGALGNGSIYTPQMVVDGHTEFVGSDAARAQAAIAAAAKQVKAAVKLSLAANPAKPGEILLRVTAEPPAGASPEGAEVMLAITESGLTSDVARGENSGRRISHTGVVRQMKSLGRIPRGAPGGFAAETGLRFPGAWRRENLRAVVFVQDRASRRILGAASLPL